MSLLALIMWWILSWWLIQYWNQPLDYGLVEQVSTQTIQHRWYASWDTRQLMVQRAYELGWLPFVIMIECESWFNPNAVWDSGRAYGLCQMNNRWHKVSDEYKNSWEVQIDTCYQKWKGWTKFYGPQRIIKWQKCYNYVSNRFIF
jgi:hypothetical protein